MIVAHVCVGEVAHQIRGVTFTKAESVNEPTRGYLPVLRAGNIRATGLDFTDLVYVPASRVSNSQKIKKNDVVIAASSGSLDVVGKAARSLEDYDGGFGAFCKVLRPRNNIDPSYFAHYFQTPFYRRTISSLAEGANINNLKNEHLNNLIIPLPPLAEQRRIAAILDRMDMLRAKRSKVLTALDELKVSVFRERFLEGVGGETVALPDAFWFQEGPGVRKWQFRESGVKLLNVSNIMPNGRLDLGKSDKHLDEAEAFGKYAHFLVDEGDLVVASSGIRFDDDGYLRTRGAFVSKEDLPLCMNTSTIRFKGIDGVSDLRYLQVWLTTREFRRQISRLVTGSAQQNFGPSHLRQLSITLPKIKDQRDFAKATDLLDGQRAVVLHSQRALESLVGSLRAQVFA